MDEPKKFRCPKAGCDASYDEDFRLQGHIGGAHSRVRDRNPIRHGTKGGYQAHLRRGERTCMECRRAWATHMRAYKKKARARKKREGQ